jgi:hypothetical protein
MSGCPKYSNVGLDRRTRERLERERRQRAEEEAKKRARAEAQERQRRMSVLRSRLAAKADSIMGEIRKRGSELYAHDARELETHCREISAQLPGKHDEEQLLAYEDAMHRLAGALSEAASRKRREEQEARRLAELDQQRFRLSEVDRQVTEIPAADASKFDPEGAVTVAEARKAAAVATAAGKLEAARNLVSRAEVELTKHTRTVAGRREQWNQQCRLAERAVQELIAHVQGLLADAVLERWHGKAVAALSARVAEAKHEIALERFARPAEILAEAQRVSARLIEEANSAQMKAEQRDYIANSIVQTLSAMNFHVNPIVAEHPDHPASAMTVQATAGSNKSIYVSVPMDGKIIYNIEGYAMTSEVATGGGRAAACDEAELVLADMQEKVQAAFGVEMGEIWWESKDPDRVLRKPDQSAVGNDRPRERRQ